MILSLPLSSDEDSERAIFDRGKVYTIKSAFHHSCAVKIYNVDSGVVLQQTYQPRWMRISKLSLALMQTTIIISAQLMHPPEVKLKVKSGSPITPI